MLKIHTKENIKKMIILILISFIYLNFNINAVYAKNTITEEKKSNYIIDINDEKEVSETIKNFILTVNSEGMNKEYVSETFKLYTQLTEQYSNNEIIDMIEQNRVELEKNNVKMENIDSIITVLKNISTKQLTKIISQIDVEDIARKIQNGESIQSIIKDITDKMTASEKVDFVMEVLLSANIVKKVIIALLILFAYRTLLRCVIYKKAGKQAWAPFIPIYRNIVMLKICNMSPWWLLLLLIPVIGWIILFIISVASKFMLAESFGKGTFFAFGLWILAPLFETILVVSRKTKYIGFEE